MYKSKYENPYRENTEGDVSLYKDPEITDSIKENKDIQTVEIEKGEIVAKPDLAALYKAQGKTHGKGGIKTYLEPDSFVYSNDRSMAINKKEHELMELKQGGSPKDKRLNTPAEVLKRNIDIKHYNKLINNLEDPIVNDLAKKSSALMLSKYQESLGKIAYLQESKKQFEEGVPDFAQNSAPVYDVNVKTDIKEQPQYMKYGGTTLPKYTPGGMFDEYNKCPCGGVYPNCTPCPPSALAGFLPKATYTNNPSQLAGYNNIGMVDKKTLYHSGTDPVTGKQMSNSEWINYLANENPIQRAKRQAREKSQAGTDNFMYTQPTQHNAQITPGTIGYNNPTPVPELKNNPSLPYDPQVGMSYDQTMNLGYSALNAASVKRYDPMRQQIKSSLMETEYFNQQGALNENYGAANSAMAASRVLNPYLANAANMEVTGKLLDSNDKTTTQFANLNAQAANQGNLVNNRIQREDLQFNSNSDSKYYDQTVAAGQNFDDLKTAARNETVGLYNMYRGQNRQLQEFLRQQPIAGSVPVKDKKGNVIGYRDMPLYGYDSWSGKTYRTGAGNIMNARAIPQQSQFLAQYQELGKMIMDSKDPKAMAVMFNSLDSFIGSKNSPLGQQYKKGGLYNPFN